MTIMNVKTVAPKAVGSTAPTPRSDSHLIEGLRKPRSAAGRGLFRTAERPPPLPRASRRRRTRPSRERLRTRRSTGAPLLLCRAAGAAKLRVALSWPVVSDHGVPVASPLAPPGPRDTPLPVVRHTCHQACAHQEPPSDRQRARRRARPATTDLSAAAASAQPCLRVEQALTVNNALLEIHPEVCGAVAEAAGLELYLETSQPRTPSAEIACSLAMSSVPAGAGWSAGRSRAILPAPLRVGKRRGARLK
jgi:hypothetical protein